MPCRGAELGRRAVVWEPSSAIVSQFGGPAEAKRWLGGIGLSSVPQWCQPHHTLSTGQAYRADLARRLQACVAQRLPLMVRPAWGRCGGRVAFHTSSGP